ncbi:TetR/AcrR family transcriptional regulator [Actinomadura opuntiae]|uniref:TetR/AcrR family transcriptional regulator n=1 Tax=Actinomadura sp. OS1-43 TaxID=604315 RepID=UPI00255ACFB5|nr:TetR/AcrR family transcriptional regulator [Actinomadura sp. OS1-43]MDL4816330.1 TetR/AcrR family transcriptional regulator [Actinomadura sp. OS1-43]
MGSRAGRGPYAKSATVRRRVVEACVEAFARTGFYGVTMKDVAKRAGISYTGLLHHFPAKEDLLLAVLEFRTEQSTRLLEAAGGRDPAGRPLEALRGMLAVTADNALNPGLLELHCVIAGEATSPDHPAHAYYTDRYRSLRAFYTTVFTALAERGELRSPLAPATLATMTIALRNGLQNQWLHDRDGVDVEGSLRAFLTSVVPALAE